MDEDLRFRFLFHMAGCAVLTLLINAMTAGPLLSLLDLDKETSAESEMFVKCCRIMETRLEEEAKRLMSSSDCGLGLASHTDWQMVWRQIPLFTADVGYYLVI